MIWLEIYAGESDYTENGEITFVDLSAVHKVHIERVEGWDIGDKDHYTVNIITSDTYTDVKDFATRKDAESFAKKLMKLCAMAPHNLDCLYFVDVNNVERVRIEYEKYDE